MVLTLRMRPQHHTNHSTSPKFKFDTQSMGRDSDPLNRKRVSYQLSYVAPPRVAHKTGEFMFPKLGEY